MGSPTRPPRPSAGSPGGTPPPRGEGAGDGGEGAPTVQRLEALAAERTGKEAGLFVASGTMGNLVSVLSQTRPGQEIILDLDSPIFNYEVARPARSGGVQAGPSAGRSGRGAASCALIRHERRSVQPTSTSPPPASSVWRTPTTATAER